MKQLTKLKVSEPRLVFTDIDGTLTTGHQITADTYSSLWELHRANIAVVPVTGRPAGWCEMIARTWPVAGVIGENGAFYFRLRDGKMQRHFIQDTKTIIENRQRLDRIKRLILEQVPEAQVASDQASRLFDLAIDFAEDVTPALSKNAVLKIKQIFESEGATAKVSSIHVNGWIGDFDKLICCKAFLEREFSMNPSAIQMLDQIYFIGDSPNDEPMFKFFPNSVGVANIRKFSSDLQYPPAFVTQKPEGQGFSEFARHLLS